MCNFFSFIMRRNGDLLSAPEWTDSHEDLIVMHGLRDEGELGAGGRDWTGGEFVPPIDKSKIEDLSTWTLRADEETSPDWWDADKVREACAARVERMIVRDDRAILVGGPWILLGGQIKKIVGRVVTIGSGANLERANLERANLVGAYLRGANLGENDPVPSGWTRTDNGLLVRS
jgi:hypothetical protein